MRMTAQPDPVTDFDMRHFRTDINDGSGRFMPADKGKLRGAPHIVAQAEVGMADTAIFHLDIDIVGTQRPQFI